MSNIIIKYGLIENKTDITNICFSKLCINNIIYIPDTDVIRSVYFKDNNFGKIKYIFITINNITEILSFRNKIFINTLNNKIYVNSLPNELKHNFYELNIDLNDELMKIINKYYNTNIQTSLKVIKNIANISKGKKMLVFGLGYDSDLWFNLTNKNTYFIEDNNDYIKLNKNIPPEYIEKYLYKIKVKNSYKITDTELNKYKVPEKILKNAPFDIIYVDGPNGYSSDKPGRIIPYWWSKNILSKKGTIIYGDDFGRNLESYCIHKFFKDNKKKQIDENIPCCKIYL